MALNNLMGKVDELSRKALDLVENLNQFLENLDATHRALEVAQQGSQSPFMMGLTIFVLAVFVGYYVVWHVTPALHSPLMAVTNAISSVIIVGALLAAGLQEGANLAKVMGFLAVILASVNIFGGFVVTQRMLKMFSKR